MFDFLLDYGLIGLFVACFLAATILPFSSDFIFGAMILAGLSPFMCILIATLGNWMGGMTNYYLGRTGKIEWVEKYLKIKPEKIYKMHAWLDKRGAYMAFFSFVPFVGDVMAVALGYMRANKTVVTIAMLLGKLSRYVVVYYLIVYAQELGIEKWLNLK